LRIVDLRPALEQQFSRRWGEENPHPVKGNPLSSLWTKTADALIGRRVEGRPRPPSRPFVLSVGNLALGGTGKTPVIIALARDLARQGKTGCVLTRGFKSPLAGPLPVRPDNVLAGDEARLMSLQLADQSWPVIQSRDRAQGFAYIMQEYPDLDYILIEDGHQTRNLGRHLDILILDRWVEAAGPHGPLLKAVTAPVFPFGPYRESAKGARRAGILLVETAQAIPSTGRDGQATATYTRRVKLSPVNPGVTGPLPQGGYAALSGIARPVPFEAGLEQATGRAPQVSVRLKDHQEYGPRLVGRVISEIDQDGPLPLVTTAKDWVKLEALWPAERMVFVADLELEWGQPNALPQLVRERAESY